MLPVAPDYQGLIFMFKNFSLYGGDMCLLLFFREADYSLKQISKEEANVLRKAFPDLEISRTMRQRAAKHHFVPEYPKVIKFLENYWLSKTVERFGETDA